MSMTDADKKLFKAALDVLSEHMTTIEDERGMIKDAIDELADIAYTVNNQTENIGARRLHTIIEKLLEDILFDAPNMAKGETIEIDRNYVCDKLKTIVLNEDLSRYIL
mgnify:CR=1 FL=1